jgi:hypothetical protein
MNYGIQRNNGLEVAFTLQMFFSVYNLSIEDQIQGVNSIEINICI